MRSGFLDWLFQFSVTGDDGELYFVSGSILSLAVEKLDVVSMNWTRGKGHAVRQQHAYPNILPRGLYSDEVKQGERFDTL